MPTALALTFQEIHPQELTKFIILGINGVAVPRNGLILWENGATGSRKVFKYLLGLWDTMKNSKIAAKVQNAKMQ